MKWSGIVGFFIEEEVFKNGVGTGVWKKTITDKHYVGDILRDYRNVENSQQVNDNININNTISIIADRFIDDHIMDIAYISFKGYKFKVKGFTQNYPRLELTVGGLYNENET